MPRPHERVPEFPVVTREEPQGSCCNLRKITRFSPPREMMTFWLQSLEGNPTVPVQPRKGPLHLEATHEVPPIPVSTREEHHGSRQNSRRALVFPPHLEMRVHFPASSGKQSLHSLHTSSGGGLNLNLKMDSSGRATIPKDADVPIHCRYTRLPCTDLMITTRIDSKHDGNGDCPVAP